MGFFSVAEAAEQLGLTAGEVYRLIRKGALAAVHVGKRLIVREAALRAYQNSLTSA